MTQPITESRQVTLTEALDTETGLFELMLLTPGLGSSGYYSRAVVEAAGTSGAFPKGTHLYLDHPTESEDRERPERSVRDLAGALTESARWNGEGLVAKAKVYSTYRPLLAEAASDIGMSIRATAEVSEGLHEGRPTRIVERIDEGMSVDFVTRPGRGGAVLAVIESARAIEAGTLNSDMHERLTRAVQASHGGDSGGAGATSYVRDFDDTDVYFVRYSEDAPGTFRQSYSSSDDDKITLSGDPIEVRAETTYVPVAPASGDGTTTESAGGHPMPDNTSEINSLREAAGRVPVLETERDTAIAERDTAIARAETAERTLAETTARAAAVTRARVRVAEADASLAPVVVDRIVAEATRTVPITEAGELDEPALDTAVTAALTAEQDYLAALRPTGVTGFASVASESGTQKLLEEMDRSAERAGLRSVSTKGA